MLLTVFKYPNIFGAYSSDKIRRQIRLVRLAERSTTGPLICKKTGEINCVKR